MPHVADWKKEKVAELEELTNNNEIIVLKVLNY